ncbi:MAG TPA: hypothetical protein VNB94_02205, partial [Mycobacteriales bacterium]|nr:hypothetical protein [Mycobacteriales bacterium]
MTDDSWPRAWGADSRRPAAGDPADDTASSGRGDGAPAYADPYAPPASSGGSAGGAASGTGWGPPTGDTHETERLWSSYLGEPEPRPRSGVRTAVAIAALAAVVGGLAGAGGTVLAMRADSSSTDLLDSDASLGTGTIAARNP